MKRLLSGMFVAGMMYVALVVLGGLAPTIGLPLNLPQSAGNPPEWPGDSQDVMTADQALVMALAKSDKAAAEKMFDAGFVWTNSDGETATRAKVLKSWPKPPLGDESGSQISERSYGQVGAVQVASGKVHILRSWVKRAAGWRLLDYQELTQRSGAAPPRNPRSGRARRPPHARALPGGSA